MTSAAKRALLGLLSVGALCAVSRAQEVVAVVSSAPGPYQAAFDSFQKDFGRAVVSYRLPREKPAIGRETRVVLAFGGEAVLSPYPKGATLIACLAPGLPARSPHGGAFALVSMKPPPATLLAQLKKIQPGMKRLAVLWNPGNAAGYLTELRGVAAAQAIDVVAVEVSGPGDIPDALRTRLAGADALWLGPDPRLITPGTFQTIRQFSWDNHVPFYVPTPGLAAAGAAASVSVAPAEMGRQVAELARRALSGETLPETVYPDTAELTVNPASAAKAGLRLGPEALARADRVLP